MAAGSQFLLNCRQQTLQLQIAYPQMKHQRRSMPNPIFYRAAAFKRPVVETQDDGVTRTSGVQADLRSLGNHVNIAGNESAKLLAAGAGDFECRRTGQVHDQVVQLDLVHPYQSRGLCSMLDSDAIHLQVADRLRSDHRNSPSFRGIVLCNRTCERHTRSGNTPRSSSLAEPMPLVMTDRFLGRSCDPRLPQSCIVDWPHSSL